MPFNLDPWFGFTRRGQDTKEYLFKNTSNTLNAFIYRLILKMTL